MIPIFVGNLSRECNLEKLLKLFNSFGKCYLQKSVFFILNYKKFLY